MLQHSRRKGKKRIAHPNERAQYKLSMQRTTISGLLDEQLDTMTTALNYSLADLIGVSGDVRLPSCA
jgi:hypothetical protein